MTPGGTGRIRHWLVAGSATADRLAVTVADVPAYHAATGLGSYLLALP